MPDQQHFSLEMSFFCVQGTYPNDVLKPEQKAPFHFSCMFAAPRPLEVERVGCKKRIH